MSPNMLPAFVLVAIGMLSGAVSTAQSTFWQEGEALPALRLPTIDGERTVDLRELTGKRTLLIEFASW